jgi:hypothetical protein
MSASDQADIGQRLNAPCYLVSCNTNILRTMHSNSLSGTSRKVKSSAHTMGNSPRSGIIYPNIN